MKQRSHAWIALRALKLIDDLVAERELRPEVKRLDELLFNYLPDVYEGAWIPDSLIVDMAYGHTFKMERLHNDPSGRFVVDYRSLKRRLGSKRRSLEMAKDVHILNRPYKAHVKGGKLPNRVLSISNSLSDMLKLSEFPFGQYTKVKRPRAYGADGGFSSTKVKALDLSPHFTGRQIALTYFLLSHYIADGHMPLHCDARDLTYDDNRKIDSDFHPKLEKYWESHMPGEEVFLILPKLSLDDAVARLPEGSIFAPISDGVSAFNFRCLADGRDEWEEMVDVCRASLALSYHLIPDGAQALDDLPRDELEEASRAIFADAVKTVAAIWVKSWMRYVE